MLISSAHNLNLCSDSQETLFLWNVLWNVFDLAGRVLSGLKPLGFASWLYTPIKHSRSFIKHYLKFTLLLLLHLTELGVQDYIFCFPVHFKKEKKNEDSCISR